MSEPVRPLDGIPGEPLPPILPRWYARVGSAGAKAGASGEARGALRIGSVSIFDRGETLRLHRFGPARESLALFEGYLFDRLPLARELEIAPDRATEARIVAAGYRRWGAGLFEHLDGGYLAAIWDHESRLLLAGRDALGNHPLYWSRAGDALWLTSNILALADSGRVPKRPDRVALALRLLGRWPRAGDTFFAGIRRLQPGHLLRLAAGRLEERRYWHGLPDDDEPWIADERARDEFEPRLRAAVDRCLDVGGQGVMLSGGVDSVAIAALAVEGSRARGGPDLTAISAAAPPGFQSDAGAPYQRPVAERLGMRHRVSDVRDWLGDRDWWEVFVEELVELPSPTVIWWTGEYMGFYRWAGRQGPRILLTGSGGDEWLGVPYPYLADLVRQLRLPTIAGLLRAGRTTGGASRTELLRSFWLHGLLPHANALWETLAPASRARRHRRTWLRRLPAWWCPDRDLFEETLSHLETLRLPGLDAGGRWPQSILRHAVRHFMRNPFGFYEGERNFHGNSLAGIRLLAPFHDRQMAEFFFRMSPEMQLHGGRSKGLLRPIVARRLPGLGLESQRKDYPAEERDLSSRSLRRSLPAAWPSVDFSRLFELGLAEPGTFPRRLESGDSWPILRLARMAPVAAAALWLRARDL